MAEEAKGREEAAKDQGSTPGDLMEDDAAADEEKELSGDGEEAGAAKVRRVPRGPSSWRGNSTKQHTFLTEIGVGTVCVGQERKHHTDEKVPNARRRKRTRFQGWC